MLSQQQTSPLLAILLVRCGRQLHAHKKRCQRARALLQKQFKWWSALYAAPSSATISDVRLLIFEHRSWQHTGRSWNPHSLWCTGFGTRSSCHHVPRMSCMKNQHKLPCTALGCLLPLSSCCCHTDCTSGGKRGTP